VDVCGTLDCNALEAGALLGVDGLFATALKGADAGALSGQDRPFIVAVGTLGITTGATSTGSIKWLCHWFPIDDGASVAAA